MYRLILNLLVLTIACMFAPAHAATAQHTTVTKHHTTTKLVKRPGRIHSGKKILAKRKSKGKRSLASDSSHAQTHAMVNADNIAKSALPGYLLSSIEQHLVDFVRSSVSTIRYTAYKLGGTKIDTSRGVYVVDCSTYVDHILKTVYPNAYTSLTSWSGTEKPTSDDYYQYFNNLSGQTRHWDSIEDVEKLRPGDILVFRYKIHGGTETGGHVMVVMDKPVRDGDTFAVRIADSAPTGHTKDTRKPHASGIGIGTMLLKVDPNTYQPYAYAWKVGSRWKENVNFAMARPVDVS